MMATLVMVAAADEPPPAPVPRCRHSGCEAPGTNSTVLVRGSYSWELRHCDEHVADGPSIGRQLGYLVESSGPQVAHVHTLIDMSRRFSESIQKTA